MVIFTHSHFLCACFFPELYFPWKIISGNFLRPRIEVNSSKENLLWLLLGETTLNYIHFLRFFFLTYKKCIFGLYIPGMAVLWVQFTYRWEDCFIDPVPPLWLPKIFPFQDNFLYNLLGGGVFTCNSPLY